MNLAETSTPPQIDSPSSNSPPAYSPETLILPFTNLFEIGTSTSPSDSFQHNLSNNRFNNSSMNNNIMDQNLKIANGGLAGIWNDQIGVSRDIREGMFR